MKRLAAVALIAAGLLIPAIAQRPAGGHAGPSAPTFHGGSNGTAARSIGSSPRFSGPGSRNTGSAPRSIGSAPRNIGSAPRFNGAPPAVGGPKRFAGAPRYNPGRSLTPAHTFPRRGPGDRSGNDRDGDSGSRHHRDPYRRDDDRHEGNFYNPYAVTGSIGWVSPYVLGYGDSFGSTYDAQGSSDNSGQPASQAYDQGAAEDYGPPPPDQTPAANLPPWPSSEPSQSAAVHPPAQAQSPAPVPDPRDAVTIIFKDGRPPEQIQNYLLTATTLYVHDQHRRDIPLSQLDLVATAKANHDAGVDFRLPGTPK